MVKPSPALQEPSGATYMSTVDFDADAAADTFEHGPTDLPPRPYMGGPDATSPWKPRKNLGTIPGSAMDYVSSPSFIVIFFVRAPALPPLAPCCGGANESAGKLPQRLRGIPRTKGDSERYPARFGTFGA